MLGRFMDDNKQGKLPVYEGWGELFPAQMCRKRSIQKREFKSEMIAQLVNASPPALWKEAPSFRSASFWGVNISTQANF